MKSDFGKLMRAINSNMNKYIGKNIEKYGIRQGQLDYFLMISQIPGINQLDLANYKNVGKASVTKAIKILESDGLVRREIDETDRRNVCSTITEKGNHHLDELLQVKMALEKDLFAGFSEEEMTSFYQFMIRLYNNSERLKKQDIEEIAERR